MILRLILSRNCSLFVTDTFYIVIIHKSIKLHNKMLTLLILLQMTENVISEESPIVPRSNSFFEVTNWTTLLKLDANETTMSAKLFEIDNNRENTLIGEVVNGNLYNNLQDVNLCKRRVFWIKGGESGQSDPLTWTPLNYPQVNISLDSDQYTF